MLSQTVQRLAEAVPGRRRSGELATELAQEINRELVRNRRTLSTTDSLKNQRKVRPPGCGESHDRHVPWCSHVERYGKIEACQNKSWSQFKSLLPGLDRGIQVAHVPESHAHEKTCFGVVWETAGELAEFGHAP